MDEDALCPCPMCKDVTCDLVPLSCEHRPCKDCLAHHWKQEKAQVCPVCWIIFSSEPLPKTIRKRFLPQAREPANPLCNHHGFPLTWYCLKDEQLVCLTCQHSGNHKGHKVCLVEQAMQERKENLRAVLKTLVMKLKGYKKASAALIESAPHVEIQAQQTEREIKDEFEKLHRFLREEEEARISALREEEEQKCRMLKERIERITKEISTILDTISTIEQELEDEELSFLQNYLSTIKRTWHSLQEPRDSSGMFSSIGTQLSYRVNSVFSTPQQIHNTTLTRIYSTPLEPEPVIGSLIDVAKHLGNLKYRVWEKMQRTVHYTPVTLDPNTAAPCLSLSGELTSMKFCTDNLQLSDNPERFTSRAEMLGSQSFTSGRHCWDVEVGDNSNWAVGVAKKSILRKARTILGPEVVRSVGISALRFRNGHYTTAIGPVSVRNKPRQVRVELNWKGGYVTLSDPARNRHITTIETKFTEPVFPYFYSSCKEHPLQIAPEEVRVSVGALKKYNFPFIPLLLFMIFLSILLLLVNIHKST